jgi:hypothetical protein
MFRKFGARNSPCSMFPRLKPVALEWASFQVMRRTNASVSRKANIDDKVAADQRGHGLGDPPCSMLYSPRRARNRRRKRSNQNRARVLDDPKLFKTWSGRRGSNP